MGYVSALGQALDWFEAAGVDRWNFCVLCGGMIGHDRPRDRAEVLRSGGWGYVSNGHGRDVYLRPAGAESWPIVYLDDVSTPCALGISKKYSTLVIETSASNCQVWVATSRLLTILERHYVQRSLCPLIGSDPGSTSGDHFGRAPGFRNQKPGRNDFLVRILAASAGQRLDPTPYLASPLPALPAGDLPARGAGGRVFTSAASESRSDSEQEFRYALARFAWSRRAGHDPAREIPFLLANIADRALKRKKRQTHEQAEEYARRTVEKAARVLGVA